jgi:uncharacterized iron-regulated protein
MGNQTLRILQFLAAGSVMIAMAGCAVNSLRAATNTQAPVLLLGEQHDAPGHSALHAQVVGSLAQRGQLAALALEMADAPFNTQGLAHDATEDQVRDALQWNERAWPWARYSPAVMAAVRAKVPVMGANLPRSEMQDAMKSVAAHALFSSSKWLKHLENIRVGHCDLLPASQIEPMARVQVQRDIRMAQTLVQAAQAQRTVVLIAGAFHADPELGVAVHVQRMQPALALQSVIWLPEPTGRDYCAEFRQQMKR